MPVSTKRAYAGQDYRIRKLGDKSDRRDSLQAPDGRERALATDGFYFYDLHPDGAMPKSVLRFPSAPSDPIHSCPLPVELCEWLIDTSCPKGGRVLDPCAGVGTTAVAAVKKDVSEVVCVEAEEKYVERIKERLAKLGVVPTVTTD